MASLYQRQESCSSEALGLLPMIGGVRPIACMACLHQREEVPPSLLPRQSTGPAADVLEHMQEEPDKPEDPLQQDAGVEMKDDFEGALEDVPEQPEDLDSPRGSQEDRLDQAMGDTGDQARLCWLLHPDRV